MRPRRKITVLSAFLAIVLVRQWWRFSVDVSATCLSAKEEMQRSADSFGAGRPAWEYGQRLSKGYNTTASIGLCANGGPHNMLR